MVVAAAVGLLGFLALAWLEPGVARGLAAKEGPLEHAGHVVLLVALAGWGVETWRAAGHERRGERRVCLAFVVMCGLVLGEELDWGGVYEMGPRGGVLHAATGYTNLHNAWSGASYLVFAMLPLGLVGVVGWRRGDAPGRLPRRRDALGIIVLGASSLLGTLVWPAWERELDEVVETVLYLGLAWIAVRPVDGPSNGPRRASRRTTPRS